MKAVQYWTNSDVRVVEVAIPPIGAGELLIQMVACGVCGSDVMEWYMRPRAPLFIGHEPAGIVAAVGAGVSEFKVGDRVFVHHHIPCGDCHLCRSGRETQCPQYHSTHLDPAGLAEYVRVPPLQVAGDVLRLPDDMTWDQATLIEPVACGLRAIKRVPIGPETTVAIIGAGFSGLLLTRLAKYYGAAAVVVYDLIPYRREQALAMGADVTFDPRQADPAAQLVDYQGRKADVVFIAAANANVVRQAFKLAERGASILVYAPPQRGQTIEIDPSDFMFYEWIMTGSYSAAPSDTREALHLIHSGLIDARRLITHRFTLDEAAAAIALTANPGDSLKSVVYLRDGKEAIYPER
jgi:L-iditol 2-dehydrogenase